MDNKELIKKLKIKNITKRVCEYWEKAGITISEDNFFDIQKTLYLQDKIIKKLDDMDSKCMCTIYQEKQINVIQEFKKILVNKIDDNLKYVFFIKEATKIGAVILNGRIIKENADFIIKESEIFGFGCSIFFHSLNNDSGICLWKGEYDSRIYVW